MKTIPLHKLIPLLAKNLEKNVDMNKKDVCNHLVSLMEGIANQATVRNNLPKEMKKWKEKIRCPTCNKRINKNMRSIAQHNIRAHGVTKLEA